MSTDDAAAGCRLARVRPGDRVRLVSPASYPDQEWVDESVAILESWGLRVEVGEHALDRWGFTAGTDADRLADLDAAFRDPGIRAIVTTRGGAGTYRIADAVDATAVRADPKPVVGFSDITDLHLALWRTCRLPGIHGCLAGEHARASVRQLLMTDEPITVHRDPTVFGAELEVAGSATGFLMGGNLSTIAHQVGAGLPDLDGAVLLLEDERTMGIGRIDRQLTQLTRSGSLDGVRGVALGRFPGFEDFSDRGWTLLDVLHERLDPLGVPILGGLPLGHGADPVGVPLGTMATLDTHAGTLTVASPCDDRGSTPTSQRSPDPVAGARPPNDGAR